MERQIKTLGDKDFYEGAGMLYMNPALYTPTIRAYLDAEHDFLHTHLTGIKRVLEMGCGAGNNLMWLAPLVGELVGLDYAEQMVTLSTERTQAFDNVRVIQGDALDLDASLQQSFDRAFLPWNTFANFQEAEQLIILRELKKWVTDRVYLSVYQTGEHVMDARFTYYEQLKMDVIAVDGQHVTVRANGDELTLYAYHTSHYERIFAQVGYTIVFHELGAIGQMIEAIPQR